MNAQEAKELANKFILQDSEGEYQRIIKQIKEKAAKGSFEIIVNTLSETVKSRLTTDGYNINYNQADFRFPREGSTYTISWK